MSRKRFTAEQIIGLLREADVKLSQSKLANAEATGAEVLVTDCPGCVLQLRGGMDQKSGRKMEVKHIAEIIGE